MSSIKNFSMFKKCLSFLEVAKEFVIRYLSEDFLRLIDLNTLEFYQVNDIDLEIIYVAKMRNDSANSIYLLIKYIPDLNLYSPAKTCKSIENIILEHTVRYAGSYPEICVLGFYNGTEYDSGHKNIITISEDAIDNAELARDMMFETHLVN